MPRVSALEMDDVPMGQLPPHIQLQRTRVFCASDAPTQTENIQYSGAYASMGVDNSFRLDDFVKNFRVEVARLDEDDIEFDMIGIDAALANAFRRILIAEVPTMAIEKVLFANNTSVIPDEVLAHRLGLIPIKADPRLFEYMSVKSDQLEWLPNGSEFQLVTDNSTSNSNSNSKPKTYTSFSRSQTSLPEFSEDSIALKHNDITIAKLGPGQVVLLENVEDEKAEELVKKCPVNVFDIEDIGEGKRRATVARPRACTLCRECIRGDDWENRVALRRVKNHFIFTIESSGALPPEVLFTEAVKVLESKCEQHTSVIWTDLTEDNGSTELKLVIANQKA
ncbi:hypothetical protein Syun_026738 [Stephania yunnanensis]|uniref:DNA-directed RNA polymerase RpoA/D/Rpb3-type domain-containing protein n=1 Tax=Stephania yunnanensis TaxID=152371 RepID=A0AAP0HP98_9MAGN